MADSETRDVPRLIVLSRRRRLAAKLRAIPRKWGVGLAGALAFGFGGVAVAAVTGSVSGTPQTLQCGSVYTEALSLNGSTQYSQVLSTPACATTSTTGTTVTPTGTTTTPTPAPNNPLAGDSFYVSPQNSAVQEEATLKSQGQTAQAQAIEKIASQPAGIWLTQTSDASQVAPIMSAAGSKVPVFVVYDLPGRDCGGDSSGGAASASAYQSFIDSVTAGLGQGSAVVIVEPDAVPDIASGCMPASNEQLLAYAVQHLDTDQNASVYVDAGNPGWEPVTAEAPVLKAAVGSAQAGFAVNTSNFASTAADTTYGTALSAAVGNRHFVIDTSRNGGTTTGTWCNPAGALLGSNPTTSTSSPLVDALLWIKDPGESDGNDATNCPAGSPPAGTFWLSYALALAGYQPPPAPAGGDPLQAISAQTAGAPGAADPSGVPMPTGNLAGWNQVWSDDFTTPVALGGFSGCSPNGGILTSHCTGLPASVDSQIWAYPSNYHDTAGNNYNPQADLSITGGQLDDYLHNNAAASIVPKITAGDSNGALTQGAFVVRFRSDAVAGYKTAFLLWPESQNWPTDGEVDFPEGSLTSTMNAFMHYQGATSGSQQDAYGTSTTYTGWHTAVIEWTRTKCEFILDGTIIGTSTKNIPNTAMYWVLQVETTGATTAAGHLDIDWAAAYVPS